MTSKPNYSEWKKKWRAQPFEDGYIETKTFLTRENHDRVAQIAKDVGERIPKLLGEMIDAYIAAIDGKTPDLKPPVSRHEIIAPTKANMDTLSDMILRSRFEGDTGPARFRQLAFVNIINAELQRGNRPIARSIALNVDSYPTQIETLAKIMEARGVIRRITLPGVTYSRAGKVLVIRDDAVEAFEAIHQREVGSSLLKPSGDQ